MNLCTTCGKRVLQTQAHITIGEDGGGRQIHHLPCWLAEQPQDIVVMPRGKR